MAVLQYVDYVIGFSLTVLGGHFELSEANLVLTTIKKTTMPLPAGFL